MARPLHGGRLRDETLESMTITVIRVKLYTKFWKHAWSPIIINILHNEFLRDTMLSSNNSSKKRACSHRNIRFQLSPIPMINIRLQFSQKRQTIQNVWNKNIPTTSVFAWESKLSFFWGKKKGRKKSCGHFPWHIGVPISINPPASLDPRLPSHQPKPIWA